MISSHLDSFAADSAILSAIEQAGYDYLVKVKLKNLNRLLAEWFIRCVGKLAYHTRRWTLIMQSSYYKCRKWESIYQQICRLQL